MKEQAKFSLSYYTMHFAYMSLLTLRCYNTIVSCVTFCAVSEQFPGLRSRQSSQTLFPNSAGATLPV